MADEKDLMQALEVYKTLCEALDDKGWRYKKNEEKLEIECGVQGEDLPMDIRVWANPDRGIITLLSHMPFVVPQDKRLDAAVAVSVANNILVDGCFDYDIKDGHLFFRMTNSFRESRIGKDLLDYMILCSLQTIDDFNDKFLMLSKGLMSIDQFLATIND